MRNTPILGALIALSSGCSLLPAALRPPTAAIASQAGASAAGTVNLVVGVAVNTPTPYQVQFNGPGGTPANDDISDLLVGLFDNGTGVMSLGYLYSGNAGSSTTNSALSTAPSYLADLETRLGTPGTTSPSTDSGYTITGDKANLRRYLIRDYLTGTGWTSNSTTTTFTDIPKPTGSTGAHSFIVFCAAYDSAQNNLGYAEAAVPVPTSLTSGNVQTALVLNLDQGILGPSGTLTETPTLTTYVPSAQ